MKYTFQHLCIVCVKEGKQIKAVDRLYCKEHTPHSLSNYSYYNNLKKESYDYYKRFEDTNEN